MPPECPSSGSVATASAVEQRAALQRTRTMLAILPFGSSPGLPFSGDGGEPRRSKYRNTRRDTHRRARRIRIADEKQGLPVATSRARLMSDVAWTVAHACRSARPHDGDYFARRYLAQRLPLQRSSQDWWRSPEVCKGRRNAHVGVGLITIAHHEKNLMVLLPSWPACL